MESIKKIKDLKLDNTYTIEKYSRPIKTKYGESYMLSITDDKTNEEFIIWSNNMLSKYITEKQPSKKIKFTAKSYKEGVVVEIEGYDRFKWNKLN